MSSYFYILNFGATRTKCPPRSIFKAITRTKYLLIKLLDGKIEPEFPRYSFKAGLNL